jgi:hypothetical protein
MVASCSAPAGRERHAQGVIPAGGLPSGRLSRAAHPSHAHAGLLSVGPGLLVRVLARLLIERSKPLACLGHVYAGAELLNIASECRGGAGLLSVGSCRTFRVQLRSETICSVAPDNCLQACDFVLHQQLATLHFHDLEIVY